MLAHEISAQSPINSLNLSKMQFDQIGASSAVLWVSYGPGIIGILIIVGILNFLLEPKLLKVLLVDEAGMELFPIAPLLL